MEIQGTQGHSLRSRLAGWAALAFAAVAWAVVPSFGSGSVGTQLTLNGAGFGSKKPKVLLRGTEGEPIGLKVKSFSDTSVVAEVTRGRPGVYDVVVRPKGAPEVVLPGTFEIALGTISATSPETPLPKAEVTIDGALFGTKRGKVKVGGKPAKVTAWTPTQIKVRLHKKTPPGAQSIEVRNKIGTALFADAIEIGDPAGGGGGGGSFTDRVNMRLGKSGGTLRVSGGDVVVTPITGGFRMVATGDVTGDSTELVLELVGYDSGDPAQQIEPQLVELRRSGTVWRAGSGGASADVRLRNGVFSISLDADLARVSGAAEPASIDIVNGSIDVQFP